jgi:hypothetical protein
MSSYSLKKNLNLSKLYTDNFKIQNKKKIELAYSVKDNNNNPQYVIQEVLLSNKNIYIDENIYELTDLNTFNINNKQSENYVKILCTIKLLEGSMLSFDTSDISSSKIENYPDINYLFIDQDKINYNIISSSGIFKNYSTVTVTYKENGQRTISIN